MRKLFTLTLALLASFSLWAADPTISSYDWEKDVISYSDVVKTYSTEGIVISSYSTTSLSNNSSVTKNSKRMQYLAYGTNATALNNYNLRIKSTKDIIDSVAIFWVVNGSNETQPAWIAWADGVTPGTDVSAYGLFNAETSSRSYDNAVWYTINLSGKSITEVAIARSWRAGQTYNSVATGDLGTGQTINILGYKIWTSPKCQAPTEELALNLSKTTDIYAGDVITVGHTGGNGSTVSYTLDGAPFNAASWTATEGEHTFAISQEAAEVESVLTCGGSDEVVLNVVAAEAVEEVTIAGATSAYVGAELTYEATADNATAYEWYLDGVKQGSDSAKFIYTAVKGSHSIVCRARNQFNVDPYPEWISSDAKVLNVTNPSGELITFIAETANANINKDIVIEVGEHNIIGGTAHQNTYKNRKLGENGKYISLKLAIGSFLEGDTVRIVVIPEGDEFKVPGTLKLSSVLDNSDIIGQVGGLSATSADDITATIVLEKGANIMYLSRNATFSQNPIVRSISVIRPMATKSTVEDLSAVTIDGNPFDPAALSSLKTNHSFNVEGSYVNAPEVKFFKEITITYEDDSEKVMNDSIVVTATENAGGKWEAQATINEVEYTITMGKATSHVVTYMFGTTELGTENVEVGGNPANYATYQTLNDGNLSTFSGWYSKSDLSGDAVTIASAPITKDTTFYASFTYKYATSVNMENFAKNNAKGETNSKALISSLGTNKYASNISYVSGTNEIDSLRADKITGNRNYPYLGLKVKTSGALINFRLEEGKTVKVKFGNVGATPLVSINGGEYAAMTITNSVYTYTATVDGELVSIKTASAAAVVFQQIAIDEELANPELFAVTCAAAENGTVTSNRQLGIPGETITLTLTPADGYKVANVKVNDGEPLAVSENTATFTMPAADANVVATFSVATAIDNTADEIKAVKFIENGQLFIRRGEKVYTITGEEVK